MCLGFRLCNWAWPGIIINLNKNLDGKKKRIVTFTIPCKVLYLFEFYIHKPIKNIFFKTYKILKM